MTFRKEVLAEGIELYNADCREVLPTLGKVDAVVTDPPYGHQTHSGAVTNKGGHATKLIDFSHIADADYVSLIKSLIEASNGWVIATSEWRHAAMAEANGLPLIRLGTIIKTQYMPQLTGDRPAMGWEAVAIYHRPGKKKWNGGADRQFGTLAETAQSTRRRRPFLRCLILCATLATSATQSSIPSWAPAPLVLLA